MRLVLQRPYLRSLCLYVLLQTICATILYYLQANIVDQAIPDRGSRTVFLANNNFWVNLVSLVAQILLTAHILRFLGIAITLVILPLIGVFGFASLGAAPGLAFVRWSQILSRSCEFALAKPARETLFTVVSRAEKYQSKSLIDTFIYRGGDAIGGWMFAGLGAGLGMGLTAISYTFVPVAAVWAGVAWVLGRRQEALARSKEAQSQ
jgi:AAA family ATP:ADP antiporter